MAKQSLLFFTFDPQLISVELVGTVYFREYKIPDPLAILKLDGKLTHANEIGVSRGRSVGEDLHSQ